MEKTKTLKEVFGGFWVALGLGFFTHMIIAVPVLYIVRFIYTPIYGWEIASYCFDAINLGKAQTSYLEECQNMSFNYPLIITSFSVGLVFLLFNYLLNQGNK